MENGTLIINGGIYSNATTATLNLTKPGVSLSGKSYTCLVTNSCLSSTPTNAAVLTVNTLAASVTPAIASKTYGSANPALTGTLSGFLAADGVTATYSRTAGETTFYRGVIKE